MATQGLKNKIAAARKLFKKAKEVASSAGLGNSNVEDGRYKAQITSARGPVEAQTSARLQAILGFKILEGEYKDEKLTSFPNLENEIGLGILIRELQNLGYQVEEFDDIEAVLAELNKDKPSVRITIKTKGEFQNISIDKLLSDEDGGGDPEPEPEPGAGEPEPEPEPGSDEIAEGDTVSFKLKGEETNGTVTEVVDEDTLKVKADVDDKVYKVLKTKATKVVSEAPAEDPEPEPEPEPSAESTVELEEGSRVVFTLKGKETEGKIVEVVDEDTVRVKSDSDGLTYRLGTDKIQPAEEKPKKKAVRKIPGKNKK